MPFTVTIPNERERLSAARDYFVRTDGDDLNDGLTNVAGGPPLYHGAFRTIQRGCDKVAQELDLCGFPATVRVGAGTYDAVILRPLTGSGGSNGSGANLLGSGVTTCNILSPDIDDPELTADAFACISIEGSDWLVGGFTLKPDDYSIGIQCLVGAVNFLTLELNFDSTGHVECTCVYMQSPCLFFVLNLGLDWNIIGTTWWSFVTASGGAIVFINADLTFTGTPSWAGTGGPACVTVWETAVAYVTRTITGTATGKRYDVQTNGVCLGASTLPGSVAGTAATGGQIS